MSTPLSLEMEKSSRQKLSKGQSCIRLSSKAQHFYDHSQRAGGGNGIYCGAYSTHERKAWGLEQQGGVDPRVETMLMLMWPAGCL
jgi:hypothetical protein